MKKRWMVLAVCLGLALPVMPVTATDDVYLTEAQMVDLTEEVGGQYNICPELLQAIAFRESSYRPHVTNGECTGLMQVDPRWHGDRMERLDATDLFDPEDNMLVATDYLAELFSEYGEADVVLMFYSGNSRARDYSQGIGEMSAYVAEVLEKSEALERSHGK